MSHFDENFRWPPPSSPSPRTILTILNQTGNGLNPMNEIFPQNNLSKDHNDQSEQRPGLGEILASSIGFNPPTLQTENVGPFSALFRNPTVPSPVDLISPGFSPSALLQSPMFSNSSLITPLYLEMAESSNEGNAATLIFNNALPHQPLTFDMPPQEKLYEIPREESHYIPSHESHVEPFGAHLVASFDSNAVDEVNNNLLHQPLNANLPMNVDRPPQEESDAVDESKREDEGKTDEEKVEDHENIVVDKLNDGSSSSKKRKFEGTNMGATRKTNTQRIILQMESEEDNPDDGFHWRKYGEKLVTGNHNPRSYYKCKSNGCKAKKRIERGAEDHRIVITTYDGIHDHPTPLVRRKGKGSRSMNRSDSSMSQNQINPTTSQLSRPSSSFLTSPDMSAPSSSLGPQTDMTKLFLTGLSKLPSLQVNHQNSGFTYQNE